MSMRYHSPESPSQPPEDFVGNLSSTLQPHRKLEGRSYGKHRLHKPAIQIHTITTGYYDGFR